MKNISNKILIAYFCIVSGVFPLFFTNYYYNIQLSKSLFFIVVTWIAFVTSLISQKEHPLALLRRCLRSPAQLAFLLFGIFIVLSAVLSAYGRSAFTGEDGRYIGAYMLLSMCMCFMLFARQYIDLKPFHTVFLGAGTIAALLGILQFMRVDPLGFSAHVPAQLIGTYLSTIGNINVFSSYLSIITVFCSGVHHMTGKKSLLLCLFVCFLALFCANSDGGFAATITVFLLSPLLESSNAKTLPRLAEQFFVFSLSCIVSRAIAPLAITAYTGLPAFFSSPAFFIPALSAAVLLNSLIKKINLPEKKYCFFRKVYWHFILFLISAAALLFLAANLNILSIPALQLSDHWGSDRGYIWKKVLQLWHTAPLSQKLFGCGPDTLKLLLTETAYQEMLSVTGKIFDSAHNSILHYLVTAGICGTLSWIACLLSVLLTSLKAKKADVTPWLMAFLAYLLQTIIMPDQPITTPLAFMVAGICVGLSEGERSNG